MSLNSALAQGILGVVNPAQRAGFTTPNIEISTQIFEASDFVAVSQFGHKSKTDYSTRNGDNLAISLARVDISFAHDFWALSVFRRQEMFLVGSRGMVDIYFKNLNREQTASGSVYDISLDGQGFSAYGLRIDKVIPLISGDSLNLNFGLGISVMKGQKARETNLHGSALSTPNGYEYSAVLNDADSNKNFLYMPAGETAGNGYALDVGAVIKWQDWVQLDIAASDLLGEIDWVDLPSSRMNVSSATAVHDADGYTSFNPTLLGVNSRGSLVQHLNPKLHVQITASLTDEITANAGTDWMKGYYFPNLGMSYVNSAGLRFSMEIETRFNSLGLGVQWRGVYLNFRAQDFEIQKSRALGVSGGLAFGF